MIKSAKKIKRKKAPNEIRFLRRKSKILNNSSLMDNSSILPCVDKLNRLLPLKSEINRVSKKIEKIKKNEKIENISNGESNERSTLNVKKGNNFISFSLKVAGISSKIKASKSKNKICFQVFLAFKKHQNYKAFKDFAKIENKILTDSYNKLSKMAAETRRIFNKYFSNLATDATEFPKLFELSSHFENIYLEFENKKFLSETKNFLEIKKKMFKFQKIVKKSKRNISFFNNHQAGEHSNNIISQPKAFNKTYLHYDKSARKISNNFKLDLLNSIKGLNPEQIRAMVCLVLDRQEVQNIRSFELDINKLSAAKLKELDNYVRKCLVEVKNKEFPSEFFKSDNYFGNNYDTINKSNKNENSNFFEIGKINKPEFNFEESSNQAEKNHIELNQNCFLGRKQKNSFFQIGLNCETKSYDIFTNGKNKVNNFHRLKSESKANINSFPNCFIIQTSCTNPETPVSHSNIFNNKFGRKNSVVLEPDSESDESSDDESYSDLQIGNFKI